MTTTMHEQFEVILEQDAEHHCDGYGKDNDNDRFKCFRHAPNSNAGTCQ